MAFNRVSCHQKSDVALKLMRKEGKNTRHRFSFTKLDRLVYQCAKTLTIPRWGRFRVSCRSFCGTHQRTQEERKGYDSEQRDGRIGLGPHQETLRWVVQFLTILPWWCGIDGNRLMVSELGLQNSNASVGKKLDGFTSKGNWVVCFI